MKTSHGIVMTNPKSQYWGKICKKKLWPSARLLFRLNLCSISDNSHWAHLDYWCGLCCWHCCLVWAWCQYLEEQWKRMISPDHRWRQGCYQAEHHLTNSWQSCHSPPAADIKWLAEFLLDTTWIPFHPELLKISLKHQDVALQSFYHLSLDSNLPPYYTIVKTQ